MSEFLSEGKLVRFIERAIEGSPRVLNMQQGLNGLQQDVKVLQQEQHRQGLMMEHMDQKLDILLEVMAPTVKKVESLDPLPVIVEQHENRTIKLR